MTNSERERMGWERRKKGREGRRDGGKGGKEEGGEVRTEDKRKDPLCLIALPRICDPSPTPVVHARNMSYL